MSTKAYTTAPILTNGTHPIPQYLDITDLTDSPEGTFKPLGEESKVQVIGSYQILSTQTKPTVIDDGVEEGNTLMEYNESTGETKVYKYISGDWREL